MVKNIQTKIAKFLFYNIIYYFSGERIDTNTFILQNGDYTKSNGSLNGTLRPPKTPTLQKNGKPYHSNPVSKFPFQKVKAEFFRSD